MTTNLRIRLAAAALLLAAGGAGAADLTVQIDGYEAGAGHVMVALFTSAEDFPNKMAQGQKIEATGKSVTVVFKALAPGRYAVSAYHDQNDNQKLDRGLFGIPKERYGFSEDARGMAGPPEFRDAAFRLGDADQSVQVHLK